MVHHTCPLTPSLARNTGLEGHAAIDAPSHRASERRVSPLARMHIRQALTTGLVVCLPCRLSCCRRTSISVMSSCDAMQDIISCNAEGGFYMDKDRILGAAGVAPTHCLAFTPDARPCPDGPNAGFAMAACFFLIWPAISLLRRSCQWPVYPLASRHFSTTDRVMFVSICSCMRTSLLVGAR